MKTVTDNDITICGHGSGNPSTKNMDVYCTTRYNQRASNGVHKGLVEVRRYKLITDENRKAFVKKYKTIIGRNLYSQDRREYVYKKYRDGKYYSDCSSSGMATYNKIGLDTGGLLNTAGIHSSSKFQTVNVTIKNGHIQNAWRLEIGDCLLFAGSDPSRPRQIGHVEYVYAMPGSKHDIIQKSYIYRTKDQTAKRIATHLTGDRVRVLEDCKDGWSLCTDGNVIGYIKNTAIKKVGKSSYPSGKLIRKCKMHVKNKKTSKVITEVAKGTAVKIITMRKYWTYVSAQLENGNVKGWVPTKYVAYK